MIKQQLTHEEKILLKDIQQAYENIMLELGNTEMKLQILNLKKNELIKSIEQYQKNQEEIAKSLQSKYGEGSIDIDKGEITIY